MVKPDLTTFTLIKGKQNSCCQRWYRNILHSTVHINVILQIVVPVESA